MDSLETVTRTKMCRLRYVDQRPHSKINQTDLGSSAHCGVRVVFPAPSVTFIDVRLQNKLPSVVH